MSLGPVALTCLATAVISVAGCGAENDAPSPEELEAAREAGAGGSRTLQDAQDRGGGSGDLGGGVPTVPDSGTAKATLERYFERINAHEYSEAWATLSDSVKASFGGYASWVGGYERTKSSELIEMTQASVEESEVTFDVSLRSTDVDACGNTIVQTFRGPWVVSRRGGEWVVTDADFTRTSGLPPAASPTEC